MSDLIYCYPESDVLKNKLHIRDIENLWKRQSLRVFQKVEKELLENYGKTTAKMLYAIDVFETPTSRARYIK